MLTLGIDIGLTGAVAVVSPGHTAVHDLPTLPDGKGRRLDGGALIHMLRDMYGPGEKPILVIEDIRARPSPERGTRMHTEGSLMRSRGIVEAVADIARLEIKLVQPQTWKRHFGLLKQDKKASLEVARRLFPSAAADLKRVKDHNRGEALLIAQWAQKEFA